MKKSKYTEWCDLCEKETVHFEEEGSIEYFSGQSANPKFDINWVQENGRLNTFCEECENEIENG